MFNPFRKKVELENISYYRAMDKDENGLPAVMFYGICPECGMEVWCGYQHCPKCGVRIKRISYEDLKAKFGMGKDGSDGRD